MSEEAMTDAESPTTKALVEGEFALKMAWCQANMNHVITDAIKQGADVNAENEFGRTPLMLAANYSNDPEVIRLLIKKGANPLKKSLVCQLPKVHCLFPFSLCPV